VRRLHSVAVIVVFSVAACGGKVDDAGGDALPGDVSADGLVDADTGPPPLFDGGCTLPNGVPLCNGTLMCPSPYPGSCASFQCVEFANKPEEAAPFGICLQQDGTKLLEQARPGDYYRCGVCASEGALCVSMLSFPRLFCAQPAVCSWLADVGYKDSCWFQDKTPWARDVVIAAPSACPAGGKDAGLCGGPCGACAAGEVCTGRSPSHPFGVCASPKSAAGEQNICGRRPGDPPKLDPKGCATGERCLVWSSTDQALADPHGFCVEEKRCTAIKAVIPGGVACYTSAGVE